MHGFRKGDPPRALRDWVLAKTKVEGRSLEEVGWEELTADAKAAIREELLRTQGHLCAYCGDRIHAATMRIEHWEPQSTEPGKRFDWANLLGVCDGTDGRETSCDRHRGNGPLHIKPDRDDVRVFRYSVAEGAEGVRVSATADGASSDIEVLNLNARWQRLNRRDALSGLIRAIRGQFQGKPVTRAYLEARTRPDAQGKLAPYLPALLETIERWLRKAR